MNFQLPKGKRCAKGKCVIKGSRKKKLRVEEKKGGRGEVV